MSELKSYEKIRESSHIHDCEWVVSDGKRVTCFNYEPDDEYAKNIGECWRELADEVQSDIEKRDELIKLMRAGITECGYPKFCENCERDAYGEPVNGCIIDNKMRELGII